VGRRGVQVCCVGVVMMAGVNGVGGEVLGRRASGGCVLFVTAPGAGLIK
jgi:hypothetical protein